MTREFTLYEVAGPKGRQRHFVYAVLGSTFLLALFAMVLYRLYDKGQFDAERWLVFSHVTVWAHLVKGLGSTLFAALLSAFFSLILAFPLAMGRLSKNETIFKLTSLYVEFFRAVPLLLMILFMSVLLPYYGMGDLPKITFLVVAMSLHHAAVTAEIIRTGITSLSKGQSEAAYAVGMSYGQVMLYVLLPQAIYRMLPALVGQFLSIVQDTSLGYIIPYNELLRHSQEISNYEPQTLLSSAFIATLMYGVISALLLLLKRYLTSKIEETSP